MLSPQDNPILYMIAVGICGLAVAGVGLSKMSEYDSKVKEMVSELKYYEKEIAETESRLGDRANFLAKDYPELEAKMLANNEINAQLENLKVKKGSLTKRKDELRSSLTSLSKVFSNYQEDYREKTWRMAPGEKIADINLKSGKQYRDVKIAKVTEQGLEIRHDGGTARIMSADLDENLKSRFQWGQAKQKPMMDESVDLAVKVEASRVVQPVGPSAAEIAAKKKRALEKEELVKILELRSYQWSQKLSILFNARSEAQRNAGLGIRAPACKGLETWAARAERIGQEITQAEASQEAVRRELSKASSDSE